MNSEGIKGSLSFGQEMNMSFWASVGVRLGVSAIVGAILACFFLGLTLSSYPSRWELDFSGMPENRARVILGVPDRDTEDFDGVLMWVSPVLLFNCYVIAGHVMALKVDEGRVVNVQRGTTLLMPQNKDKYLRTVGLEKRAEYLLKLKR